MVLMSTYNGEKYLEEQIMSILNQKEVFTEIYIRDDGSKDKTIDIIRRIQRCYPDRIEYEEGENLGYKRSFLKALASAKESDFYAFSDQDDYWLEEKCIRAIEKIKGSNYELYCSAQILTDEKLNEIGMKSFSDVNPTIEGEFTRHRLPGCTFIFSNKVRKMAIPFANLKLEDDRMPSHDMIISCLALSIGDLYIDNTPYIMYRRLDSSITPGGQGIKKRIKHELVFLFQNKNRYSFMANSIIEKYSNFLDEEKRLFLLSVARYRTSFNSKLKLLMNKKMDCGVFIGNIENKVKIFFGSY